MITSVTYMRLYNLGNYENKRLYATAAVENDNVDAAFDEAIAAVEAQRTRMISAQQPGEAISTATEKQRNYIARLMNDLGWTSEQFAVYAVEQQIDLVNMTRNQASDFIDGLKKLTMQSIPF